MLKDHKNHRKGPQLVVSVFVYFYERVSKGPTRSMSWNTVKSCWSRKICTGNTPFLCDLWPFSSRFTSLNSYYLKRNKGDKTRKNELEWWKYTWIKEKTSKKRDTFTAYRKPSENGSNCLIYISVTISHTCVLFTHL